MKWMLIDNIKPNTPALVNLDACTDVVWDSGTLTFETVDSKTIELECDKDTFISIASAMSNDIIREIE